MSEIPDEAELSTDEERSVLRHKHPGAYCSRCGILCRGLHGHVEPHMCWSCQAARNKQIRDFGGQA